MVELAAGENSPTVFEIHGNSFAFGVSRVLGEKAPDRSLYYLKGSACLG